MHRAPFGSLTLALVFFQSPQAGGSLALWPSGQPQPERGHLIHSRGERQVVWDVLGFCCLWAIWVGGWTPWESDLRGLPEGPRWWRWKPPLLLESAPPPPRPVRRQPGPLQPGAPGGACAGRGCHPVSPEGQSSSREAAPCSPQGRAFLLLCTPSTVGRLQEGATRCPAMPAARPAGCLSSLETVPHADTERGP